MRDDALRADQQAERLILSLIFSESDLELLGELDARDFSDRFHRWLFAELKIFAEGAAPFGDTLAWTRHIQSPACAARFEELDIPEDRRLLALDVFNEFAPSAHARYYLTVLRRERLNRSMLLLAAKIRERVIGDPDHPMKNMHWLTSAVDKLWAKGASVLKEEIDAPTE